MSFLKDIFNKIIRLLFPFKKTCNDTLSSEQKKVLINQTIPNIISSNHNCALIALHIISPETSESKILEAFYHCCEQWPNGGVTNREFNIVLKFLNIDTLSYCDKESTLQSLLEKDKKFIALVHGHYLAISNKNILEYYNPYWANNTNEKVYCYWQHNGR